MTNPTILLLTDNDLVLEGANRAHLSGTRPRALFVMLALYAGTPLSRDWLSELLWPDAAPGVARQRLRMTLLNLRRSLCDSLAVRLDATPETLCLDLDSDEVDLLRFERLVDSPDSAAREGALAFFAGDLLSRFPPVSPDFDAFLSERRERVRARALSVLHDQMRQCRGEADIERFERIHQKSLTVDPLNEESLAVAMSFWSSARRRDRISEIYDAHARRLKTDLSAAPSLESAILRDSLMEAAAVTWTPPAQPALQDGADEPPSRMPVGREPATRRRVMGTRGRILSVVVLGLLSVLAVGIIWARHSARAEGPIFLVRPAETPDGSCDRQAAIQTQRALLLEALDRIAGSTIVIGRLRQAVTPFRPGVYEIRHDVACIDTNMRATISVLDGTSRDLRWIGRFEGVDLQPEVLATQISEAISAPQ